MAERQSIDGRPVSSHLPVSSHGSDDQLDNNVVVNDIGNQNKQHDKSATSDMDSMSTAMGKLDVGSKSAEDIPDCAVCLQKCIHPVRLPCNHVFCFLCVKGVAMQSGRCALCRKQITAEFFSNPTVLGMETGTEQVVPQQQTDQYAWFYEGRNGWWQYEERTNQELEESYRKKLRTFELLIAGFVYTIDLDNMVQMRRSDPSRRRRIKRDLVSAPKKGIAGLKIASQTEKPGGSLPPGASREVVGGDECNKSGQATGGAIVDGATQTQEDNLSNPTNRQNVTGASVNTSATSTDESTYEVLPPRSSPVYAKVNNNRRKDQRPRSAESATRLGQGQSKSNKTNSLGNQKKSKPKPQMRNSVPNHPTSHSRVPVPHTDPYDEVEPQNRTSHQNNSYGLVVHHQRSNSSPSRSRSGNRTEDGRGATSSQDSNVEDVSARSNNRGEEESNNTQTRRQARQRRKNLRSSDV